VRRNHTPLAGRRTPEYGSDGCLNGYAFSDAALLGAQRQFRLEARVLARRPTVPPVARKFGRSRRPISYVALSSLLRPIDAFRAMRDRECVAAQHHTQGSGCSCAHAAAKRSVSAKRILRTMSNSVEALYALFYISIRRRVVDARLTSLGVSCSVAPRACGAAARRLQ
jgi:hypothetical protein